MTAANVVDDDEDDFLTPAQIAKQLNVSDETVYRWCRTGVLPAKRLGRGKRPPVRVQRAVYDRWLADQPAASS